MTRAYFYNEDIKEVCKDYDIVSDKINTKEDKRKKKKRNKKKLRGGK